MSLLDRVRKFVLGFAILATAPAFIALAKSTQAVELRAVGFAAVPVLVAAWVWAYRQKRLGWQLELLAGAVLFAIVQGSNEARVAQGFFFATLMFNGLWGGVPQLVLRLLLVQGAFFSREPLASTGALSVVGFSVAGIVVWSLGRALEKQGRLEDELRAREARFRSLVTNASDMIVVLDQSLKITWQSPAVQRQLGRELISGEVKPAPELTLRHANGSLRECEARITDLSTDLNVSGVVLNIRDVTERNHAATVLKKRELELAESKHEIEIAAQIQTALLPRELAVPGFDLAAIMVPATEVGGDYYDVLPTADGCYLGIGDVAGHGLNAGLIMLMVQSVVAALVRERPDASPRELVVVLNEVLHENVKNRMRKGDHVTLSLLKLLRDGTVTFAGAHEELVVQRSGGGPSETLPTPGTWLGAMSDVSAVTVNSSLKLSPGDLLLLHTDGVTEARNDRGEMFGMERLLARLDTLRGEKPQHVVDMLRADVAAWSKQRDDDVTLLAVRYSGA